MTGTGRTGKRGRRSEGQRQPRNKWQSGWKWVKKRTRQKKIEGNMTTVQTMQEQRRRSDERPSGALSGLAALVEAGDGSVN